MSIVSLSGSEVAKMVSNEVPDAVVESGDQIIVIKSEHLFRVAELLKNKSGFAFNYLADMTAVDYYEYFEVVYQLVSMERQHSLTLRTRCTDRNSPVMPSVTSLWQGADYMEREIFDLMGITFEGHPNMKRIVLWEGFQGHPLRKDYL